MSDPQRPHGLQPTRLLHPWDFPGRSPGVGCHCLLLNVRLETLKLLEENIGKTLSYIDHSKIFYDTPSDYTTPSREMEIKAKINKWDLIKLKSFCTMKETISKVKDSLRSGKKQ